MVATGCSNGSIRVWDVRRSGSAACMASLDRLNQSQTREAHTGTARMASRNCPVCVWVWRVTLSFAWRADPTQAYSTSISVAHTGSVTALHFPCGLAHEGRWLVSSGSDSNMMLWDMDSHKNSVRAAERHHSNAWWLTCCCWWCSCCCSL